MVSCGEEESLSKVTRKTCSKVELHSPTVVSVVSLGKSIHHNNSIHLLRITK